MIVEKFWSKEHFPLVYENNQPKAVIVDVKSFEKIEFILDNLINRDEEPEDAILVASGLLKKLVDEVKTSSSPDNKDWRAELDVL